jgi:hypothetical protein
MGWLGDPTLAPLAARDFDGDGFKPGWVFGSPVLLAEFFGGILVRLGAYMWVAAAAFGFEMRLGSGKCIDFP